MGFDPIMMAMINRLTKGGGAGYVSTEVVEILPETQVQYNNSDGITCQANTPVVLGKTYSVLWDGVKYNCTCVDFTSEGQMLLYLGNTAAVGGADTGEPFAILAQVVEGMCGLNIVGCVDENDHTCSIMGEAETIHTIDPKFIPGAVLPVVEITTAPTTEGAILTEEERAKMDALNGAPCILAFRYEGMPAHACPLVIEPEEGIYSYSVHTSFFEVGVTNEGGSWIIALATHVG